MGVAFFANATPIARAPRRPRSLTI
jgi:hypothetical protein